MARTVEGFKTAAQRGRKGPPSMGSKGGKGLTEAERRGEKSGGKTGATKKQSKKQLQKDKNVLKTGGVKRPKRWRPGTVGKFI